MVRRIEVNVNARLPRGAAHDPNLLFCDGSKNGYMQPSVILQGRLIRIGADVKW